MKIGDAVTARVPASSANLGPGFDSLGLALGLYDEVDVEILADGLQVEVDGEGAEGDGSVARDEAHLVVRTLRATFDLIGEQPPGLWLRCRNLIPHSRGLGSSAAAIVAGVVAARALAGEERLPQADALALASRLEGHPDNVAASLLGGLTIAWTEDGVGRAARLQPHPDLRAVAFVPETRLGTNEARGLIPAVVPHAEAAQNAGRAALLIHALTTDPGLLLTATEDRLHQDYRLPAYPEAMALVQRLRKNGVAAVISGAGPTVLALALDPGDVRAYTDGGWVAHELPIELSGATVARHAGTHQSGPVLLSGEQSV